MSKVKTTLIGFLYRVQVGSMRNLWIFLRRLYNLCLDELVLMKPNDKWSGFNEVAFIVIITSLVVILSAKCLLPPVLEKSLRQSYRKMFQNIVYSTFSVLVLYFPRGFSPCYIDAHLLISLKINHSIT